MTEPPGAGDTADLPPVPHPTARRSALPWHRPKSIEDDSTAAEAVQAIIRHPSYREADRDVDFLNGNDTRGVRLQLDYLKAELLLQAHGVAHTIVVFGGTRVAEPQAARRDLDACIAAQAASPDDPILQRRLAIARRVLANSRYYDIARALGALVGAASPCARGGCIMVMTGGGPGIMEAANRGAHDVGCGSIGLNIALPHEQYPNPYVSPELCFSFHYFAVRKLHFLLRARALVVFPGGYGTMDELFEVLNLVQTRKIAPLPVVLVGQAYWRQVFDPDFLVEEGMIDLEDRELFWFAETADEIWNGILRWYERAGGPLLQTDNQGEGA
ncbi:MAG: LOG family protein [Rhodopila sp.]|nr:LOG family protein [Rhodopila sp.]